MLPSLLWLCLNECKTRSNFIHDPTFRHSLSGMSCKNAQLLKLFQDLKKRLDVERTEKRNSDHTAIKLLSEVEGMRQQARDLRKQETR